MRKRIIWYLLALVGCVPATAAAEDWYAYTSENFTVYSDANRGEAVEILENFELFRRVVLATLNLPNETESQNLKIVMFSRPRDFDRFVPDEGYGGFFYHSVFGPRMMVGPSWSTEYSQQTLFHEYVHYLMNRHSTTNYPRWYAEGLAQVLQTTEIRSSSATVGNVLRAPRSPMRLDEVIDTEYDDMDEGFYFTSWLLTHYLMIDSISDLERRQQTREYLIRYDNGEDPTEALVTSFGMPVDEMQQLIDSYSRRSRFTVIEFPEVVYEGGLERRALSEAEELYLLGDIAVELGERETAFDYFAAFDETGDSSVLADRANSRRAIAYIHDQKVAEADAAIAALVADGTSDADVLADIAHYAYDRYVHAVGRQEYNPERWLAQAIDYGNRAVAANPDDLEALFYLGLSHERNGELQLAVDSLLEFYDVNPSVTVLNMNLARVLIKGKQKELALYLIARAYSSAHAAEEREEIRSIQRRIEADDFDISTIDRIL